MPTSHLARRALQWGLLHARSASTASTGTPARRPYVRASAKTAAATTPAPAAAAPAAAPNPTAASSAVPTPVAADSSSSPDAFFDSHIDIGEMMLGGPAVPSAERITSPSSSTSSAGFSSASSFGSSALPSNNAIPSGTSLPIATSALDSMIPSAPAASSFGDQARDIDWTTSFHGMSAQPFPEKAAKVLMRPLEVHEVEIKPDGLLYLPEILYRRFLNQALGPGGWGMVPRGELTVMNRMVSREWGLVAGGRLVLRRSKRFVKGNAKTMTDAWKLEIFPSLVSVARGEQAYFDPSGLPTATEGCKSNALMRCCKDLGIASELWDPSFIRKYKSEHCVEVWTEHVTTKKKQKRWRKKGNKFEYPLTEARA